MRKFTYRNPPCMADFVGLTFIKVVRGRVYDSQDEIRFYLSEDAYFVMTHDNDCCETVEIESIVGDLQDLVGRPILQAEESTNRDSPPQHGHVESFTWTFYKLATVKGWVDIRWLGESNGYYSERVKIHYIENGVVDTNMTGYYGS